jgi:tRNA threonylcarbamoyladenosine biosynthesis protein TsaB
LKLLPVPEEVQPIILAIDSCSLPGSISLCRGNEILFEQKLETGLSHSLTLLETVDEAMRAGGIDICNVDVFAASSGPGSFTGLRIGLATVKAFGATFKRPCVGVPTLHAIAITAGPSPRTLAMLPAGRGEVFAQLLSISEDGLVLELSEAVHLPPAKVIEKFSSIGTLCFAGKGASENFDIFRTKGESVGSAILTFESKGKQPYANGKAWSFFQGQYILSSSVAMLALQESLGGRQVEAGDLLPNYVRPSDPELKLLCR